MVLDVHYHLTAHMRRVCFCKARLALAVQRPATFANLRHAD